MRIFAITWMLAALTVAVVTTILQLEPALWIINLILDSENQFLIIVPLGITFIILISPLLLAALFMVLFRRLKKRIPDIKGKTGITVARANKWFDVFYVFDVLVDDVIRDKVAAGHMVFIEEKAGKHRIIIKNGNRTSNELEVMVNKGEICQTKLLINPAIYKSIFPSIKKNSNTYILSAIIEN